MRNIMDLIEKYIEGFEVNTQEILKNLRVLVLKCCPEAQESFSYAMPAYKFRKKPLIYFAGYKNHIGLYATPRAHEALMEELSKYKQGKGSVQIPLDQDFPYQLFEKIIAVRMQQIIADQ